MSEQITREAISLTRTRDWDAVFSDGSRVRLEFLGLVVVTTQRLIDSVAGPVAAGKPTRATEVAGWDFRETSPGQYGFVDVATLPTFSHFERTP